MMHTACATLRSHLCLAIRETLAFINKSIMQSPRISQKRVNYVLLTFLLWLNKICDSGHSVIHRDLFFFLFCNFCFISSFSAGGGRMSGEGEWGHLWTCRYIYACLHFHILTLLHCRECKILTVAQPPLSKPRVMSSAVTKPSEWE